MSKYHTLWEYLREEGLPWVQLSFDEIRDIVGFDLDHSFLTYKKELTEYGYQVEKISLKDRTVAFKRAD